MAKNKSHKNTRPVKSKKARVQKKQRTAVSEDILREAGLSNREIKNLPASVRNDPEQAKRKARHTEYLDFGIPESIIKLSDLDSKDLTPKAMTDFRNQGLKLDELSRLGITDFKKGDLRLSWPKFIEKFPGAEPPPGYKIRGTSGNKKKPKPAPFNPMVRLSGSNYLYIGAAEIQEGFVMEDLSNVDDTALIEKINDWIAYAKAHPTDSSHLYAVFKTYVGSRSDCETIANSFYKRGYQLNQNHAKLIQERYNKVTISNSFSQREFHEMLYTCITQMKNEDVSSFIDEMIKFCNMNNFPFMKNLE